MAEKKALSNKQKKTALAETLWLNYFNSYLYENGILTESQRNRMIMRIENRKGSTCGVKEKRTSIE